MVEPHVTGVRDISYCVAERLSTGHCVRVRSLRQEQSPIFLCIRGDEEYSNSHFYLFRLWKKGATSMKIILNFFLLFSTFTVSMQVRRIFINNNTSFLKPDYKMKQ